MAITLPQNLWTKELDFPAVAELFGECDAGNRIEVVNPVTGRAELI